MNLSLTQVIDFQNLKRKRTAIKVPIANEFISAVTH